MDSSKNRVVKTKAQWKRERNAEKYKKFAGNQKEGQGFANRRKVRVMHEYNKIKRKHSRDLEQQKERTAQIYKSETDGDDVQMKEKVKKKQAKVSRFHKAELEAQRKSDERMRFQMEREKQNKEREEALARYKKTKKAKNKKLLVKTFKGQPNMANQMDLLLQKIEKQSG